MSQNKSITEKLLDATDRGDSAYGIIEAHVRQERELNQFGNTVEQQAEIDQVQKQTDDFNQYLKNMHTRYDAIPEPKPSFRDWMAQGLPQ